ncbi:MAG TPA: hypothetical protein VFP21_03780 [Solirubrobacterales bacterium]|nr:hypothetical protein [Solirubrobacterales bacterium]
MIRRLAGVVPIVCALFALCAGSAGAEAPAGPRLTFLRWDSSRLALISANAAGADQRLIAGGGEAAELLPVPFSPPSWSADGNHLAFAGTSSLEGSSPAGIYLAAADGTGPERLSGTQEGFYPVLSPDGLMLAFARHRERQARRPDRGEVTVFHAVSIWLLDLRTGAVRQFTPWHNGLFEYPSSFSPDGLTLGITRDRLRHGKRKSSAIAMRLDGSGSTVLAEDAGEPVYSPDGTRLALITTGKRKVFRSKQGKSTDILTELAVAKADGSALIKLTHTRGLEVQPSWDPSGQRLAYTELSRGGGEAGFLGFGDSIMEINADGTCRTRILSYPNASLYGATWQPGPGREAGPIAC